MNTQPRYTSMSNDAWLPNSWACIFDHTQLRTKNQEWNHSWPRKKDKTTGAHGNDIVSWHSQSIYTCLNMFKRPGENDDFWIHLRLTPPESMAHHDLAGPQNVQLELEMAQRAKMDITAVLPKIWTPQTSPNQSKPFPSLVMTWLTGLILHSDLDTHLTGNWKMRD